MNVFAKANRDLSGYKVDSAHTDYGNTTFDIEKGNILAIGEGQTFYIDGHFDSLSPIGSIMEIHEVLEEGDLPMRVDYETDKIRVFLSKNDFADYKALKTVSGVSVALTTAIVLPVLLEALHIALADLDNDDDKRWVRALRQRIKSMNLNIQDEPLELAQLILELPVKRTLSSAKMFSEGAA